MSKTNLLKEAIADAKTVRETAIANAKIALEEAFTPKLQSMLSKKIQEEMEDGEEMEDEMPTESSHMDMMDTNDDEEVTTEEDEMGDEEELDLDEILREMGYGDDEEEVTTEEDEVSYDDEEELTTEEEDEDEFELDLESIIRELEDEEDEYLEEDEMDGVGYDDPTNADDASLSEEDEEFDIELEEEDEMGDEEELDLDEILREMGYGDDDELTTEEEDEEEEMAMESNILRYKRELTEAYGTIKKLKKTINEVNLLNAKLLYSNKLFRGYELTNEQKRKVIDTIDRTTNLREVKLVFSSLAEVFKMNGVAPGARRKKNVLESLASKRSNSTAPKKQIIKESDELAHRFQKLANIKK
jgi:uncharacterized protein YebE (UPF0316 family)